VSVGDRNKNEWEGDDPTESANFEDETSDEYNPFDLELKMGIAPESDDAKDNPVMDSFLHGSLVFVPVGEHATDSAPENTAAIEEGLGEGKTDTLEASKYIPNASKFVRRRRLVLKLKRIFLLLMSATVLLSLMWILVNTFVDHQRGPLDNQSYLGTSPNEKSDTSSHMGQNFEEQPENKEKKDQRHAPLEATLYLGPSDNGTEDVSETELFSVYDTSDPLEFVSMQSQTAIIP
jgi:hypothetical protein